MAKKMDAPIGVQFTGLPANIDDSPVVQTGVNEVTIDQRGWQTRDAISDLLNPGKDPFTSSDMFWVCELYDTYAVVSKGDQHWTVPYQIDAAGVVTIGDLVEVEHFEAWVPVAKSVLIGAFMPVETKTGARNAAADLERMKKIEVLLKELMGEEAKEPAENEPAKSLEFDDDTLTHYGGELKSLGLTDDGGLKVGGYLVRFSDSKTPDLVGDYFDANTDFGDAEKSPAYFHHGLDVKLGKTKLGKVDLKKDEFGVWAEGIITQRDEYEKFIGVQIGAGKMGWSSGTASHLVEREAVGGAHFIKSWPLGLDASITHVPAEPRNEVIPLKSLSTVPMAAQSAETDLPEQEFTMLTAEELKSIADQVTANLKAAMPTPAQPEPTGITTIIEKKQAPAVVAEPSDDNTGIKAMEHFFRTGDIPRDLRPDVGYKYYPGVEDPKTGIKTTYNWSEGGTNDGYALVPPDYWAQIVEKRYEPSIFRGMGAQVFPTSSNIVDVPVENTREPVFVKTTESTGASDQTTTEPVAQKVLTVFLYSRKVPVSFQLLNDSIVPVEGFLAGRLAHAAALTENSLFTVGSGNGQTDPEGIFVGGTAGLTFASATAIAQGEIESLLYAMPSAYQSEAVWVMRNATLGKIRKITGNWFAYQPTPMGQPGKAPGNAGGSNGDLQYKPVWLTDYAVAVAASAKSLAIVNPSFYGIAENAGMMIQRNPYDDAAHHNVNFYAYIRLGGGVLQAEAVQYATHPSA